jgi:hypothetical protein
MAEHEIAAIGSLEWFCKTILKMAGTALVGLAIWFAIDVARYTDTNPWAIVIVALSAALALNCFDLAADDEYEMMEESYAA